MRILILYVCCFGDQLISILRMLISSSAWIPDRKSQQSPVDDQEAQLLHLLNDPMSCQGMGYGILRLYVIFATPLLFTFAVKKPYENPRRRNYTFAKCHSCFDNKGKHPIIIVDGAVYSWVFGHFLKTPLMFENSSDFSDSIAITKFVWSRLLENRNFEVRMPVKHWFALFVIASIT